MDAAGEQLRDWRNRRNMTQEELARAIEARVQSVSAWERGKYDPRPATVRQLDEVLEAQGAVERLYGLTPQGDDLVGRLVEEVARLVSRFDVLEGRLSRLEMRRGSR